MQQLCSLVVQAFLAALPDDAHLPSSSSVAPPVRVLPLVGLPQTRGFVTPGEEEGMKEGSNLNEAWYALAQFNNSGSPEALGALQGL